MRPELSPSRVSTDRAPVTASIGTRASRRLELPEREPVDAWIVEADGEPVGYLQSWWEDDGPRRGGLDGFRRPQSKTAKRNQDERRPPTPGDGNLAA